MVQLEALRRASSGRLSGVMGKGALGLDRFMRDSIQVLLLPAGERPKLPDAGASRAGRRARQPSLRVSNRTEPVPGRFS